MTTALTAEVMMRKAAQAVASARLLLESGDVDGACNRAYYAMFDAARAALLAADTGLPPHIGKTHQGLINAFSLHLIKPGILPKELGRQLKRAEEARLVADYTGDIIDDAIGLQSVEAAEAFVFAIREHFAL
ncbi:HEPN domain-containing protein [Halochromatium roseum]|uniref:HEPN domain-containing protein n=1 Tax=Halochromatium roseum TaxID=391920 RepID=UPI0030846571